MMKPSTECIPCLMRQAWDAVQLSAADEALRSRCLQFVLRALNVTELHSSPPVAARNMHRMIRALTGNPDPYRQTKDRFNRLASGMYPQLRAMVERSPDPMAAAVRLAIAGNVIDSGVNGQLDEAHVREAVDAAVSGDLVGEPQAFAEAVARAGDILYLADNAGEVGFDRLLIETVGPERVTLVVRGGPVLNDATACDARACGIPEPVQVIDNGSDAPGTILEDCSETFRQRFDAAEVVIAKGQGNYESLSDAHRSVFFLLKVKCAVIAKHLGREVGSMVVERHDRPR